MRRVDALLLSALLALAACGERPVRRGTAVPPVPSLPAEAVGSERPGWWHGAVFYEVFVRSFADASEGRLAGDGIGDLRGLIERLDHLNDGDPDGGDDLEVDALWLMPVADSPSYHGYDVRDYYAVEPDYGTAADFAELIDEAHRRGLRVIVDLVLNHTSSRHPWFRSALDPDSEYRDWYLFSESPRGYLSPWGTPVWHDVPWWRRGITHLNYLTYYGLFSDRMPDLNHRNPEVTAELYEVARFWLEEMGVDGFRLDAVRHLIEEGEVQEDTEATHRWLRGFAAWVRRVDPEALIVGEVWSDTESIAAYGPDEVDLCFQFELAEATLDAVRFARPAGLVAAQRAAEAALPGGRYATFLSNHDQVRSYSRLDRSPPAARLAASLLLTSPGTPFLYYGEEIGMTGLKPDPHLRSPMQWSAERWAGFSERRPWQAVKRDHREKNVAAARADPDSLLAHYRRLIRLRHRHPALSIGDFGELPTGHDALYAFERRSGDERLLIVANLGERPVAAASFDAGPAWRSCAPRDVLQGAAVDPGRCRPRDSLAPRTLYVVEPAR